MKNFDYAIKVLLEKAEELQSKKGEDKDLNDGLESLIKQLSDSVKELQGENY